MDRALLRGMLHEGLSLAEIARRSSLHESTVGYWVKKHELRAVNHDKHRPRGELSFDELQPLVDAGRSISEIAQALDRSKASVRHWLARYDLHTHGHPGRPSRSGAREARQVGRHEAVLHCPRHGRCSHVCEPRGYYRCRRCRKEAVTRRRRRIKQILVVEAGGRCQLCAYDRCLAALEFHHVDPSEKHFGMARNGVHGIDRLRAELRKCVLLCGNCHAEVEAGMIELTALRSPRLQSRKGPGASPG